MPPVCKGDEQALHFKHISVLNTQNLDALSEISATTVRGHASGLALHHISASSNLALNQLMRLPILGSTSSK